MHSNPINFLYNLDHVTLWGVEVGPVANAREGKVCFAVLLKIKKLKNCLLNGGGEGVLTFLCPRGSAYLRRCEGGCHFFKSQTKLYLPPPSIEWLLPNNQEKQPTYSPLILSWCTTPDIFCQWILKSRHCLDIIRQLFGRVPSCVSHANTLAICSGRWPFGQKQYTWPHILSWCTMPDIFANGF